LQQPGEDTTVGGLDHEVIGTTAGGEYITVSGLTTAEVELDASFNRGGDTISLPGEAEEYTAHFEGSRLILTSVTQGVTISMPVPAPGTTYTLIFREDDNTTADDDSRQVTSNTDGQAVIGDQEFDQGETDQLDSNDASSLAEAIRDFQDAEEAIEDFEEENEMTIEEAIAEEAACEAELEAARDEASDEELEAELALQQAQLDAAEEDAEDAGIDDEIEAYEDAAAAEEATQAREDEADAEVAAAEARYNSLNPDDAPISIHDDGAVYADGGAGPAIIEIDPETGDLVLTEYGEDTSGNEGEQLLEALQEREDAEAADDEADADLAAAEEELDLADESPNSEVQRENAEAFEDAVAEYEEELADYRAGATPANAAALEAAYAQLQTASEGDMPAYVTAEEIENNEEEIDDAIEAEREENRDEILAAEAGDNPLYEEILEERDDVEAAQGAVDDREALIEECQEAEARADEARALRDARDQASQDVQDQGDYEAPVTLDDEDEEYEATEGNDLFIAGDEDGEGGTVIDFGEEGNDALYIGEEYTIVNLGEGDAEDVEGENVGNNDVLEAFIIETEDGVMIFIEENSSAGNVGDGDFFGAEILLDGVQMDEININEGFIMG
jgi:hypothetical protein